MIKDYFKLAFNNLSKRKLRSWLTMIGIFIGIAAVVSLISLSIGLNEAIVEQFEELGANKIFILPRSFAFGAPIAPLGETKLTDRDIRTIEKVSGVELVSGFLYQNTIVKHKDEVQLTGVSGMSLEKDSIELWEATQSIEVTKGRNLEESDKFKAVMGFLLAEDGEVFEKGLKLRDEVIIQGDEYKIVGIMEPIGNRQDDSQFLVPLESMRETFDAGDEVTAILAQIDNVDKISLISERVEKELRKARDEEEGEETFEVQTPEDILRQFNEILGVVQVVLVGIAGISLIVGGLGIMNTMYTSVLERTKDIGVMKAIGARNNDIMWLFLAESGIIGMVGGVVGTSLGFGMAKGVEVVGGTLGFLPLKASTHPAIFIFALFFSFIIGAVSGVLPALKAAKLKPVDALRYE
jgi:putative ABC transport system permease protein